MSRALLLWLPPAATLVDEGLTSVAVPWLSIDDGVVVDSGQDDQWIDAWEAPDDDAPPAGQLIALAPAEDVPVRWLHYPDAAPAQAAAAARVDALRDSLGEASSLHIVAGAPATSGQAVAVAVTTHAAMAAWTDWLAARDLSPSMIIPAGATLPPPAENEAWTAEFGDELLVRTADRCFLSDGAVDSLVVGEAVVTPLPPEQMRAALMLSLAAPPLDLLSGAWKPKRGIAFDPQWLLWIKRLLIAVVVVSLLVPIVYAVRIGADTRRADATALEAARKIGVTASDAAAVEAELDRRLAAAGGGPMAFSVPASALYAAMGDAPGVVLRNLSHRTDGTLTTTLAAPRVEDINQVLLALQARGYRVTAQPMAGSDGLQSAVVTIRAVP